MASSYSIGSAIEEEQAFTRIIHEPEHLLQVFEAENIISLWVSLAKRAGSGV
jgi:hypothetical protein